MLLQVSLGPGLRLGLGLRSQVKTGCKATAVLSLLEPQPPGEKHKQRGGEKRQRVCYIKMEDIGLYIPCHSKEETPYVSMVTGTPPCTSCCCREEAPVCRSKRKRIGGLLGC